MFKVGLGQDSHKLQAVGSRATGQKLILGGVKISEKYYLEADSDGDVIVHSLCNALSTAIGGGSLDTWAGEMFQRGVTDSREFLKEILIKVKSHNYKISNVAIMVEAGNPKLEKFREKMQVSLAKLLETKIENIGIAFTTGEDLTSFGRGEGIQVISTILLEK